jgi:SAM-dependent methyltransferase
MGRTGITNLVMRKCHAPIYIYRLRELARQVVPHLVYGDRVLDVGCGFGALGKAIMEMASCPSRVKVVGLEQCKRDNELIDVKAYKGDKIPYDDGTFDVVILADVLHHESNPHKLISECARVSRRLLIIKDHKIDGWFAKKRVSFIDWAANDPYGVKCLYRFNSAQEWRKWHQQHGLVVEQELMSMRLYPPIVNLLFGGRLQYMAVLRV